MPSCRKAGDRPRTRGSGGGLRTRCGDAEDAAGRLVWAFPTVPPISGMAIFCPVRVIADAQLFGDRARMTALLVARAAVFVPQPWRDRCRVHIFRIFGAQILPHDLVDGLHRRLVGRVLGIRGEPTDARVVDRRRSRLVGRADIRADVVEGQHDPSAAVADRIGHPLRAQIWLSLARLTCGQREIRSFRVSPAGFSGGLTHGDQNAWTLGAVRAAGAVLVSQWPVCALRGRKQEFSVTRLG